MVRRSYVYNSRINPFKIEMINDHVRRILFKKDLATLDETTYMTCLRNMQKLGLTPKDGVPHKPLNIKIPDLFGDIQKHFFKIANDQALPYKNICETFKSVSLPSIPSHWILKPGWTRYEDNGHTSVEHPDDEALIFDVEVCLNDPGNLPTLATAVSSKYWYSWCNPLLTNRGFAWQSLPMVDDFIPLESSHTKHNERLVIGHNVGYDRSWIKEQYYMQKSKLRFIDTMSLHLSCSGLTHLQRASKMAKDRLANKDNNGSSIPRGVEGEEETGSSLLSDFGGEWENIGSLNNLADIHDLYCKHNHSPSHSMENYSSQKKRNKNLNNSSDDGGEDKVIDIFLKGNLEQVRSNFQRCMKYCALDCFATHEVFKALIPMFFERFPHPVTFAGMLEMGTTYLPTRKAVWERYLTNSESTYRSLDHETRLSLVHLANEACSLLNGEKYKEDPWLWDLDWSTQSLKLNKSKTGSGSGGKGKAVLKNLKSHDDEAKQLQPGLVDGCGSMVRILRKKAERLDSLLITLEGAGIDASFDTLVDEGFDKDFETSERSLVDTIRWPSNENEPKRSNSLLERALATADRIPKIKPFLPGYPAWYRELCVKPSTQSDQNQSHSSPTSTTSKALNTKGSRSGLETFQDGPQNESDHWKPGPFLLNSQARVAPKLMRLTWDGYPLHFHPKYKWGYLVPGNLTNLAVPQSLSLSNGQGDDLPTFPLKHLPSYSNLKRPPNFLSPQGVRDGASAPCEESMSQDQMQALWTGLMETSYEGNIDQTNAKFTKFLQKCRADEKKRDGGSNENSSKSFVLDTGEGCTDVPGCWFYPLPHKQGPSHRVGNPLSKDFVPRIDDGTLSACSGVRADKVLTNSKLISYWKNSRLRIRSQLVVYCRSADSEGDHLLGAILPRVVVCGTVSRRAVEPTWLTASNAREDRLGSELKAMIQAPPGYNFVGADVDSQELWIAALLGDSNSAKVHGCTAFGWMTLQGNKQDKTDMHSKTASLIGTTRDQGKVLNYARIYGAGQKFATRILMQFNHRLSRTEASKKAKDMFLATKGRKVDKKGDDGSVKKVWYGGSESHMFNELEAIATHPAPATPFLGCRICRTLEPRNVDTNFMTSRTNWVVQSSAVDFLHLMLVCMKWLFDKYEIKGRYCISIHDEVRYIVAEQDRYRAALALQITNLMTRSFFSYQLGMYDLPVSVAFFSSVDVDTCLRKEVDMDCITPSNPQGLQTGYGILKGEALDIYQIVEKTQGTLEPLCSNPSNSVYNAAVAFQ